MCKVLPAKSWNSKVHVYLPPLLPAPTDWRYQVSRTIHAHSSHQSWCPDSMISGTLNKMYNIDLSTAKDRKCSYLRLYVLSFQSPVAVYHVWANKWDTAHPMSANCVWPRGMNCFQPPEDVNEVGLCLLNISNRCTTIPKRKSQSNEYTQPFSQKLRILNVHLPKELPEWWQHLSHGGLKVQAMEIRNSTK